jgi:hypothetical protein
MSRTIKTMPPSVQAIDRGQVVEYHNHQHGECDLPEKAEWLETGWVARRHCMWTYSSAFYYEGNHFCGCRMCTGYHERRHDRRRDRHQARLAIRRGDDL